jgi:hypothetical protein
MILDPVVVRNQPSLLLAFSMREREDVDTGARSHSSVGVVPRVAACSSVAIAVSRALSAASRRFCAAARVLFQLGA